MHFLPEQRGGPANVNSLVKNRALPQLESHTLCVRACLDLLQKLNEIQVGPILSSNPQLVWN